MQDNSEAGEREIVQQLKLDTDHLQSCYEGRLWLDSSR